MESEHTALIKVGDEKWEVLLNMKILTNRHYKDGDQEIGPVNDNKGPARVTASKIIGGDQ